MTGRAVFVATELEPELPGGAAAVIDGLARRLAATGRPLTVVLVAEHRPDPEPRPGIEVVVVPPGGSDEEAPTWHLAQSRAAARVVAEVVEHGEVEFVEFQDFGGLGFWAFARRHELGLARTSMGVRFHGTIDLIAAAAGVEPPDLETIRVMEGETLGMADFVIVPTAPVGELVAARYGLEADRVVVGEPPVPITPPTKRRPAPSPEFVVFGKLGEVKGSLDVLGAAVDLLDRQRHARVRFVGGDDLSFTTGRPMEESLRKRVPKRHRDRIHFEGRVRRDAVPEALASAWAVVIPSRFESFCLAAHEARAMGFPLVLPDLPAFQGYFDEAHGAVVYDGTVSGLAGALGELAADRTRRDELAAAPPPAYADPLAPYTEGFPPPRHPRQQAGLATTAFHHLEEVVSPPRSSPVLTGLARRLLQILPRTVAAAAVRLLPQGVKDRFRRLASWPAEVERRAAKERRDRVAERIEAGEFPELTTPEVSVVIPCFNQGEFLDDALVSVFEQTFSSWEVIVVDDGSDDPATVATVDGLELPRLRVVRQDNRGLPGARNAGMAVARGKYLVPLDADDELTPTFLEELVPALESAPQAAYSHCWAEYFGALEGVFASRPFNPYQLLLSDSVIGCVVLRKAAWQAAGGYDETMVAGAEDWELWVRLLGLGWGQVEVRKPLFRYRRHGLTKGTMTEARFEALRREVFTRNSDLYRPEALRSRKAEWYPWVSILVSPESALEPLAETTLDDLEIVSRGDVHGLAGVARIIGVPVRPAPQDLGTAVRLARGKFVVDWDRVEALEPAGLERLAAALEDTPKAVGAALLGSDEPLLWRRWTLLDRYSPHGGVVAVAVAATPRAGTGQLAPGGFPTDGWSIAPDGFGEGIELHRQPPEEEGRFPGWVGEAVERETGP